jgi:hypothetical protein
MEAKKILIPNKPHLDPIAAIYILGQYGQEQFPGIDTAEIIFYESGEDPSEEERARLEGEGVLMIDVGGGLFDHHQSQGNIKETSASLAATYLGVENNPELNALLSYVREDDLEGLHNRFGDLAYLLKCMHKQNMSSTEVVQTALQVLHLFQTSQLDWHQNVHQEYEAKCKIIRVKHFKRKMKVGIIESDNIQVANYGITADNLSVVIQLRSTGHVMILTNKLHRIDLREIIGAIRKRELELRGYTEPIDPKRLQFEGKNSQLPMWFYHRSLNSFLNGSDALSKTEATKVPFEEIIQFVIYGLTTDESEFCDCAQGGANCPFANYGFSKCAAKRRGEIYES